MLTGLSPKHERFAQAIASGMAPKVAYRAAGYNVRDDRTAVVAASRLLSLVDVHARVAELQQEAATVAAIDSAQVLGKMWRNIQIAMGDLPVSQTRIDRKTGKPVQVETYTYDGTAANRGLELIGRELGMFTERREIGGPGDFARMDDAGLQAYITQRLAARGITTIDLQAVNANPEEPATSRCRIAACETEGSLLGRDHT